MVRPGERLRFLVAGGHGRDLLKPNANFAKARSGLSGQRAARPARFRAFSKYFVRSENHPPGLKDPSCAPPYFGGSSRKASDRSTNDERCRDGAGVFAEAGMRLGIE